jgi:hypothetical protein
MTALAGGGRQKPPGVAGAAPTEWFTTGPDGWVAMKPQMPAPITIATATMVGAIQL